jgi:hypothetical protein
MSLISLNVCGVPLFVAVSMPVFIVVVGGGGGAVIVLAATIYDDG